MKPTSPETSPDVRQIAARCAAFLRTFATAIEKDPTLLVDDTGVVHPAGLVLFGALEPLVYVPEGFADSAQARLDRATAIGIRKFSSF